MNPTKKKNDPLTYKGKWKPTTQPPKSFGLYVVFAESNDPEQPYIQPQMYDPKERHGWYELVEYWRKRITHWTELPPRPQ